MHDWTSEPPGPARRRVDALPEAGSSPTSSFRSDNASERLAPELAAAVSSPPARRTVTITGRGAQGSRRRYQHPIRTYEHHGRTPDRVAMWAVLLGIALAIGAATSSHAAVLARVALTLGH